MYNYIRTVKYLIILLALQQIACDGTKCIITVGNSLSRSSTSIWRARSERVERSPSETFLFEGVARTAHLSPDGDGGGEDQFSRRRDISGRSQSTEGLAAKITSNWMGERGSGLASTPVSVQPINPLQSWRQPREHRATFFSLLRCRRSKTYWDRRRYLWDLQKHRCVSPSVLALSIFRYRRLSYWFSLYSVKSSLCNFLMCKNYYVKTYIDLPLKI